MYGNQNAMSNSGLTSAPVAQPSETVYATQVLDQSLCRLEARISDLTQKLVPVLEDRPQKDGTPGETAQRQMFSPLGRGIMETSYRVENIERRLNALLDSLAI